MVLNKPPTSIFCLIAPYFLWQAQLSLGKNELEGMSQTSFTEREREILNRYVTETKSNVFALCNLPEVIKGALFSRYSRSTLGLRELLLKEFVHGEETAFDAIAGHANGETPDQQMKAIKKAQEFYDRILDGYGDDSIGELGGAHLAVENVSILAVKAIEDSRIGGSPLEKSTRYIYFDQKVNGEYLYFREPMIMTSANREDYLATCDLLFDTYSSLIPPLTEIMEKKNPKSPEISKAAYTAAIRAKTLDCLRGLLPAATLTNMGVFGNGRFFEYLIHKLTSHPLAEMQKVGKEAFTELSKIIPSFVRRSDPAHKNHDSFSAFSEAMHSGLKKLCKQQTISSEKSSAGVSLVSCDQDAEAKVVAALLFSGSKSSLADCLAYAKAMPDEKRREFFDVASSFRQNRRHKPPRALENVFFDFEFVGDFGAYRDLHRHRLLTQERQLLTCDLGYFVPDEIIDTPMEKPYHEAMTRAKETYDRIAEDLPEEAQYVVPMAYHVRWYFHINLRSLVWLTELRSQPQGHPNYRYMAQAMARAVIEKIPAFECFFKFVDYDGYELGRLSQEQRRVEKLSQT